MPDKKKNLPPEDFPPFPSIPSTHQQCLAPTYKDLFKHLRDLQKYQLISSSYIIYYIRQLSYNRSAKLSANKIVYLWLKNPAEIQLVVDRKVAVGNLWDDGSIN